MMFEVEQKFRVDDPGDVVGSYAEIEKMAENEARVDTIRTEIKNLAAQLGLQNVEPRSNLRMLLERRAST